MYRISTTIEFSYDNRELLKRESSKYMFAENCLKLDCYGYKEYYGRVLYQNHHVCVLKALYLRMKTLIKGQLGFLREIKCYKSFGREAMPTMDQPGLRLTLRKKC